MAQTELVKQKQIGVNHFNTVNWLREQHFGISVSLSDENIINLSDYNLSETERYVLAHGLECCLPPSNIKRKEVFAEFEILLSQLLHHKPKTSDELILLKAKLNEVAHSFCGSPIDTSKFSMDNSCLQAIKSLRSNKAILITKPDKGSGVVILNKLTT